MGFELEKLMPIRKLPPLDLLMPFEAAARHSSFTRAAEELSVTQSTVSQRVRTLESILDTQLFKRGHRTIEMTDAGRELFNAAKIALQHLSAATDSISRSDARPMIKLAVDTCIASFWLLPRMKLFLNTHSDLAVDLSVSDNEDEILNADVGVLHGDGSWPGFTSRKLFSDEIFPVCSPTYADEHQIESLDDLLTADLINLDYKNWNWMNWGIWLTEAGVNPVETPVIVNTNSYTAQIDAARAGLGVALGWRHLVDQDFASGALVQPIPVTVETKYGYYVLLRQGVGENAHRLAQALFN